MDIVQFGIAFGGLGRMTSQLSKLAAENATFARKIRPIVVNTLGLAAAEGVFEQYQEVYHIIYNIFKNTVEELIIV